MERTVSYPDLAVVYDGMTGILRRKIKPAAHETASFSVAPGEGLVVLHGPPFDDATCRAAVQAITGTASTPYVPKVWAIIMPQR